MSLSPEQEKRGVYIVLEGGEGVGKSTQAALLAQKLGAILTRETGGTVIGSRIRQILHDIDTVNLSNDAEMLLVAADRAQHIHEVVRPNIVSGRDVVSDRNWLSTLAYQGFGRGLDIDEVLMVTRLATRGMFMPDIMFLLTADEATIADRMKHKDLDRFETAGSDFHKRVALGYRSLMEEYGAIEIDASEHPDQVHTKIMAKVGEYMLKSSIMT